MLSFVAVLAILLGSFSYANYRTQRRHIIEEDKAKAAIITEIIKNGLVTIMIEGRSDELRNFIETLIADDLNSVRLYSPGGWIIASSVPDETGTLLSDGSVKVSGLEPELSVNTEAGRPVYDIDIPFYNEKPCQSCHREDRSVLSILHVSVAMDKAFSRIHRLRNETLLFFVITLLVTSGILILVTKILVDRPLQRMTRAIKDMSADEDLTSRLDDRRRDEFGSLAKALNEFQKKMTAEQFEMERRHVEAAQRVEKMAAVGELAGTIAHEIKNPLAGISGAVAVLGEDFSEEDPRKEIIEEIQKEIERLDRAVRDLVSFARPPIPNKIVTSLESVIDRAVRLIQTQAHKQAVSVNVMNLEEPVPVSIDPDQVQQVLLNVMMNALHAMPGGGEMTVATHMRWEQGTVEISIADTGPGIGNEDMRNVFKPFFTTKHSGTGLGLAISKNLMESHGGQITVESRVGAGSNFRITLPLRDQHA